MSSTFENWPENAIPEAWIDNLFARMEDIYGRKFLDMWGGMDINRTKTTWAVAMGKLSNAEMKLGVDQLETRDWPPTLPEFLKMCRPEIDPRTAFLEALEGVLAREKGEDGKWSHPAIFWAHVDVSAFDMKTFPYDSLKNRWETALKTQLKQGDWKPIPKPSPVLPAPPKDRKSNEEAKAIFAQLKIMLKTGEKDPKAWAHKIIKRRDDGDRSLLPIQIQFAEEALGMRKLKD